jgi:hypothetical protein
MVMEELHLCKVEGLEHWEARRELQRCLLAQTTANFQRLHCLEPWLPNQLVECFAADLGFLVEESTVSLVLQNDGQVLELTRFSVISQVRKNHLLSKTILLESVLDGQSVQLAESLRSDTAIILVDGLEEVALRLAEDLDGR